MPRRSILSTTEWANLLTLPESQDDLIQYYTFNEPDLSLIRQRRGDANRLGFAIQLCLLRYPGYALSNDIAVTELVIQWVARQIRVDVNAWTKYGAREKHGVNTFKNYAPISGLLSSVSLVFAFWCLF